MILYLHRLLQTKSNLEASCLCLQSIVYKLEFTNNVMHDKNLQG